MQLGKKKLHFWKMFPVQPMMVIRLMFLFHLSQEFVSKARTKLGFNKSNKNRKQRRVGKRKRSRLEVIQKSPHPKRIRKSRKPFSPS